MQTYQHVIAGMDEEAAKTVAALILREMNPVDGDVRSSVRTGEIEGQKNDWPGTKSQASDGSGGSVLAQDIGDRCLKT